MLRKLGVISIAMLLTAMIAVVLVPATIRRDPVVGTGGRAASGYCADSALNSFIVRQACAANPELSRADISAFDATSILRRWAATWIDVASAEATAMGQDRWEHDSLEAIYREFLRDRTGVWCGGTAWILMRLYEQFGFEAWVYNFGDDSGAGLTHMVTLVRADGRIVVQDAYFNGTLLRNGEPAAIEDVLRALAFGEAGMQIATPVETVTKQVIYTAAELPAPTAAMPHWLGGEFDGVSECAPTAPGLVKCLARNVDGNALKTWDRWPEVVRLLSERGFPREPLSLMLLPLGLSSSSDGWTPPSDSRPTRTNALMRAMLAAGRVQQAP